VTNQSGHLGGESPAGRGTDPRGEWNPPREATGDNSGGSGKCTAPEASNGFHVGRGAGRRAK